MNSLLGLKLLLIKHGKCVACKDRPEVNYCGVCFNTRLEPEVLEAITALDLAHKFKENHQRLFENVSEDDYVNPPEGSYFNHVIRKQEKLEALYLQFINTGANRDQEKEIFTRLVAELLNPDQLNSQSA